MLKNLDMKFYLSVFVNALMMVLIVHSFMFFQVWWGDHDWGYLKDGVGYFDGAFELRYSQHWFNALFFDGHIIHTLSFLFSFVFMVMNAILMAKYLDIPKNKMYYLVFVLFFGLNPHNFALLYYVYLCFPFFGWSFMGIVTLIMSEVMFRRNMRVGVIFLGVLWGMILGSYPANMALFFVLFIARRILCFIDNKEDVRQVFRCSFFFVSQFLIGVLIFKLAFLYIEHLSLLNEGMYNIKVLGVFDIVKKLPREFLNAIKVFFVARSFMEYGYIALQCVIVLFGSVKLFSQSKNKMFVGVMFVGMLLASRFVFCVSGAGGIAVFRLEYFGKIGLLAFFLALIMRDNSNVMKNVIYIWGVVVILFFSLTDFYIQKVQYLGFISGRKYQQKLLERLLLNETFKSDKSYISYSFGFPNFKLKFVDDKYLTDEMTGKYIVFYFDIINHLFWEDGFSPVAVGVELMGKNGVFKFKRGNDEFWRSGAWVNNPENIKNIRLWAYDINRKQNDIYVDDKYILNILDIDKFYKNREVLINGLDKF